MLDSRRQNLKQLAATFTICALCVLGVVQLQLPQLKTQKYSSSEFIEKLQRQNESDQLRLQLLKQFPSLGFDNLIADWAFLNFLQYFGDTTARDKTGYSLSPEYFEVILDRDPRFLDAYLALSISSSLYAAMPERTIALMEQSLQSLSPKVPHRAYYIWRYKGTDELLFLGDAEAAQRSFEKAVEWASAYSDPEAKRVEELSWETAQFLSKNPDSKSAQIYAWMSVFKNVSDERTQQYVINRIQKLGAEIVIDAEGQVQIAMPKE